MSTPPLWLPPLDQHKQYNIYFTAAQNELPHTEDSSSSTTNSCRVLSILRFKIRFHVRVGFYSDSGSCTRFEGFDYLTREIFIPCHVLIYSPAKKVKKILGEKLWEHGIPFHLHHVVFVQKSYGKHYSVIWGKKWVENFQDFLRSSMKLGDSLHKNIVPLKVTIDKLITVPESLHKGWVYWYYYSKQLDPSFEKNYKEAIGRPRTDEELSCQELLTFDQVTTAILRNVADSFGGLEDACSICLEELSNGEGTKSLSCHHVFHGLCIKKWLRRNRACPLCRYTLPFEINWVDPSVIEL